MKILNEISNLMKDTEDYVYSLQNPENHTFLFTKNGLTKDGQNLKLGPSCYGLKLFYMLGIWDKIDTKNQNDWVKYINSFQKNIKGFPENSYIDEIFLDSYRKNKAMNSIKDITKTTLNFLPSFQYDTNKIKLQKAINAETKQAIATLQDIGAKNEKSLKDKFTSPEDTINTLEKLDWSRPWSAGAQFSSLCVYAKSESTEYSDLLFNYSSKLVNQDTGSYYKKLPKDSREVINGAMKIITGLDWLNREIHYPEKLIDYCLNNMPILEGCDAVDYIYVIYKCSEQTSYRKADIEKILLELVINFKKLKYEDSGFSYFEKKSQTHYYGIKVTEGNDNPDIHGTLLITWALILILDLINEKDHKYKIIKP